MEILWVLFGLRPDSGRDALKSGSTAPAFQRKSEKVRDKFSALLRKNLRWWLGAADTLRSECLPLLLFAVEFSIVPVLVQVRPHVTKVFFDVGHVHFQLFYIFLHFGHVLLQLVYV